MLYPYAMSVDAILATISLLSAAEIRDALWMVDLFERWGSLRSAQAPEWRRQTEARRLLLEVDENATVT